jgi:hypothetical protein
MSVESGPGRPAEQARLAREKKTVTAMLRIYCRGHHDSDGELCPDCVGLYEYAMCRLDRCPFGSEKPTCANCPIHCYKPAMRERIRQVMRYAGPRMLLRRPILAVLHQLDSRKLAPDLGRKGNPQPGADTTHWKKAGPG